MSPYLLWFLQMIEKHIEHASRSRSVGFGDRDPLSRFHTRMNIVSVLPEYFVDGLLIIVWQYFYITRDFN
jgi:hypothetical protein